jgi:hemoglobin-like flavoprotein
MVVLDATVPVPLSAITYEMVSNVMGTWEQVRQIPNWDATAGEMFTRKIFELDPETIVMFGFPASTKYDDPKLSEDKAFMAKSIRLLKAIDVAVGCLGPDLQPLEEQLLDLGARHTAMNCRPHHWPVVGKALMHVLGVCLGDRLSSADRESWTVIYNFLSFHMVRGLLQKKPILAGTAPLPEESRIQVLTTPAPVARKNIKQRRKVSVTLDCTKEVHVNDITFEMVNHVLTSWEKGIRSIPNWSSKVGFIFLRYILKHTGSEGNKLFGYPSDTKWDDLGFENDPVFRKKGERLIQAIDMALSFMGPDLQPLEFTMKDLGRRHFHMECQPEHWPLVGEALLDVFRECMGEEGGLFTAQVEESWTTLYNFLGFHMIEGLNAEKRGE